MKARQALVYPLIALATLAVAHLLFRDPPPGDARARTNYVNWLERGQAQVVFIGNSIVRHGLDMDHFRDVSGTPSLAFMRSGSASAWWYLAIKNIILEAEHRPKRVVIVFRDDILTRPTFRVHGPQRKNLREISFDTEPLLERLAYPASQAGLPEFLDQYSPLYQSRDQIETSYKQLLDDRLLASLLHLDRGNFRRALRGVFDEKNLDPDLLGRAHRLAERDAGRKSYAFHEHVDGSFLPEIINLTREAGIQLTLVRFKSQRDLVPGKQDPELVRYIRDLEAYLRTHEVPFFDLTTEPRLTADHYRAGDHLNAEGKRLLTEILAEVLADE